MAYEVFVDTNGFFAAINPHDVHHADADRWIRARGKDYRLVTTDYVLDESATLLRARNQPHLAAPWLERTMTMKNLEIEWMNSIRFDEVRRFFARHSDKDWSFTDCFSFVVM